jgi:hypothetical protein
MLKVKWIGPDVLVRCIYSRFWSTFVYRVRGRAGPTNERQKEKVGRIAVVVLRIPVIYAKTGGFQAK